MRFPGQYYDMETGFHQNWFRNYGSDIGRYYQPDPIGLAGGISVYGYALQNPVRFFDFFGLDAQAWDEATNGEYRSASERNRQTTAYDDRNGYSEYTIRQTCMVQCADGSIQESVEFFTGTGETQSSAVADATEKMNEFYETTNPEDEACLECVDNSYTDEDGVDHVIIDCE